MRGSLQGSGDRVQVGARLPRPDVKSAEAAPLRRKHAKQHPPRNDDRFTIFFDFDNTITKFDVLDDMLERFSRDTKWMRLEDAWKRGDIGSKECLDKQMGGIRITRNRLNGYLTTIKIDPSFKKILKLCSGRNIKTVILSDNFEYILKGILKHNGISIPDVYCNALEISGDTLIPSFPHSDEKCGDCAHCKTNSMKANMDAKSRSIYVGDGLSDLCPSKEADIVFAKDTLKERLEKEEVAHIPINDLGDVYDFLVKGE